MMGTGGLPPIGTGGAGGVVGAGGGPVGGSSGEAIGPGGAYEWGLEGYECRVTGGLSGSSTVVARCLAGIDGAQSCTCEVGGAPLERIGDNPSVLRAADCRSVATELASGFCTNALDCCFDHTATGEPRCDCMDPEREGFSECAALIAHYGGQRAPSDCPRYQGEP